MRVSSAERKSQLIQATVHLMRRDGVQRLNLRAIAEEAGASLAAVHYCFDGKDDLLGHAVEHWLRRMVDIPDVTGAASGAGLGGVAERIADSFWNALEESPDDVLAQIELVTWAVREAPRQRLAQSIYARYEATLGQVFAEAAASSGETLTWDAEDLARAFIVVVDGASLQFMAEPSSVRHKEIFRRLLTLLFSDAVSDAAQERLPSEAVEQGWRHADS